MAGGAGPLGDVREEAARVVSTAAGSGRTVRLLGGAAFAAHQHSPVPQGLQRTYGDIDIAVGRRDAQHLPPVLMELGYTPDERFNALHGEKRMLFRDLVNGRKFDVFVSEFSMCHKLSLEGRLPATGSTLAPADLLLTKLQVIQLNAKDEVDALGLLRDHEVRDGEVDDAIDLARITKVCADDWGWYTTVTDNLDRLDAAAQTRLDSVDRTNVIESIHKIRAALESAPKSTGWRIRARIGRRLEWYEIPDEVG